MRMIMLILAAFFSLAHVTPALAAYMDNNDGTVTDTATGLMWQKCSMGQTWNASTKGCDGSASTSTWQNALLQSENLTLGGQSDWRLPNRNELQSLVDYSRYNLAINTTYFPGTVSFGYWSSTTFAISFYTYYAWSVNFFSGYVFTYDKSSSYYVRAVRAGQSGGSLGDLVISQTPMSGPPGTTFTQWGTGFTRNGTATLHFRNPLGDELDPIQLAADGLGAFEIVYNSPPDKPAGTHFWWAVDDATGERSGTLGYEISSGAAEQTPLPVWTESVALPPAEVKNQFGTLTRVGEEDFKKAEDTFVIVHGKNTEDTLALPDWVNQMADTIKNDDASPARGANVYTWNWQKEAKPTGTYWPVEDAGNTCIELPVFQVPSQNTEPSGKFLALALKKALPPDYSGSIHMIGHSLGSLVITHAAKFAHDNPDYFPFEDRINHLVLLDSHCFYGRPADNFLKNNKDGIFVDNYYSLFGKLTGYSEADTNVYLPNWLIYGHIDGHAYSHEWYWSSVTNFSDKSILHDLSVPSSTQPWGFFWWDPGNRSQVWSNYLQPYGLQPQWQLGAVPLKEGASLVVDAAIYTGDIANETWDWVVDFSQRGKQKVKIVAVNTFNSTMDVAGYATDAAGHAFLWVAYPGSAAGVLRMEHHSDATVSTTMDIPAEVNAMTFGYRFAYAEPGTVFEVFLDDLPAFHAFSQDAITEGYRMVPWIDVSPFAGKSVNLTIRVSHPTLDASGAVEIDDLILARIESDIPGDMDGDGDVDGKDLAAFAAEYGRTDCNGDCEGDYVVDSAVNESDLAIFTGNFGRSR